MKQGPEDVIYYHPKSSPLICNAPPHLQGSRELRRHVVLIARSVICDWRFRDLGPRNVSIVTRPVMSGWGQRKVKDNSNNLVATYVVAPPTITTPTPSPTKVNVRTSLLRQTDVPKLVETRGTETASRAGGAGVGRRHDPTLQRTLVVTQAKLPSKRTHWTLCMYCHVCMVS